VSLKILGRLFTGPHDPSTAVIRHNHEPVVYVAVDRTGQPWDPDFRLIDIGDTAGATVVFAEHPELPRLNAVATGKLSLYFHVPDPDDDPAMRRRQVVEAIRAGWPPNGRISSFR